MLHAKYSVSYCLPFLLGTLPPPELSTTDPGDDFERQFIEVNRVLMKGE